MKPSVYSAVLLVLFIASCKQDKEIKVYRVARETPEAPHANMDSGTADPHAGLTAEQLSAAGAAMPQTLRFSDSPPAHWKKLPPSAMLLGKYQIEGADGAVVEVTFSTLRSAPGGLLANINRWRGQLDKEPFADDAAMKANTRMVPSAFGDAVFIEVEGLVENADPKKDGRLMGAIAEKGASAWFYKLRGNEALAAKERDNFIRWIESVKLAENTKAPVQEAAPAGDGSVTWQVPEGWTVVTGSSARYATLSVTSSDGAKGELAVTHFPGDVGGDLANVNRWRGQIGLDPIDEAALANDVTQVAAGPKTLKVIDATGPKNRCAAAWVAHGGETWFFKFTGPDSLIGAEKEKFTAFLESIRFNKPE